jgi:DNA-binding MarR family transcriptional regulator
VTEARQQGGDAIMLIGNTEILASLLGTTRQTTSTILSKLEKAGMIERPNREQIVLLKRNELELIANNMSAS